MGLLSGVCPKCGAKNGALAEFCASCGERLGVAPAQSGPSVTPEQYAAWEAQRAQRGPGTAGMSIVMIVLIIGSVLLLVIGFSSSSLNAIQETAVFAAAAVCGILARITQAAMHHTKMMDAIQRLGQR